MIIERLMSLLCILRKSLCGFGLSALAATAVVAQTNPVPLGAEYALAGIRAGDQVHPSIALNSSGGVLVWEDNSLGGEGLSVGAMRIGPDLSGSLSAFRVNQAGSGEHEAPKVALLSNQSAAFVWQGGRHGMAHIFTRILATNNVWLTGDLMASGPTNRFQKNPAVAALSGGNFVVAWESWNQAGSNSMCDVYAQIFNPTGAKVGAAFLVNEFVAYNQRSPAVVGLSNGGFVVTWVSEQQNRTDSDLGLPSTDVFGRLFNASGAALSSEFMVNVAANPCSSPSVAAVTSGGFLVSWSEKDVVDQNNKLDVYARSFFPNPTNDLIMVRGSVQRVNTQLYGDQYDSHLSGSGDKFLAIWTSVNQDGSGDGVYGQFLNSDASPSGGEFHVNLTTKLDQTQPAIATDGLGRNLVVWSSMMGTTSGVASLGRKMDLYAQRYADPMQTLAAPAAPTVVSTVSALSVSWAPVMGLNVSNYDVYVDGATNAPISVSGTSWAITGLPLGSNHRFQIDYVVTDGRHSLISAATSGTTSTKAATNGNSVVIGLPPGKTDSHEVDLLPPPSKPGSGSALLPFAAVAGSYNGLFFDQTNVSTSRSGLIGAVVSPKGSYTAKLQLAGQSYSVAGQFSSLGQATNHIVRSGQPTLELGLQLDMFGGDQITGALMDGAGSAAVRADRAVYCSTNVVPSSIVGKYTIILPGPTGNGIATLVVDQQGKVAWSGTLADGSAVSQITTLSKANYWPLYSSLYSGKGFVLGWMQMNGSVTGPFVWTKPAMAGAAYLPAGFTNQAVVVGAHSGL